MGNYIALITFGCFCVLCSYCEGKYSVGAKYAHTAKAVLIWRDSKSATIASIYNITPDELEKPIAIFK